MLHQFCKHGMNGFHCWQVGIIHSMFSFYWIKPTNSTWSTQLKVCFWFSTLYLYSAKIISYQTLIYELCTTLHWIKSYIKGKTLICLPRAKIYISLYERELWNWDTLHGDENTFRLRKARLLDAAKGLQNADYPPLEIQQHVLF